VLETLFGATVLSGGRAPRSSGECREGERDRDLRFDPEGDFDLVRFLFVCALSLDRDLDRDFDFDLG